MHAEWRQRARPCFGAFLTLKVRGIAPEEQATLFAKAFAYAQRIHDLMSRQSPDSDVAKINDLRAGEHADVAPETAEVIRLAMGLAEETDGAFDPINPSCRTDWTAPHAPSPSRQSSRRRSQGR